MLVQREPGRRGCTTAAPLDQELRLAEASWDGDQRQVVRPPRLQRRREPRPGEVRRVEERQGELGPEDGQLGRVVAHMVSC
jgi:hypothetical protein